VILAAGKGTRMNSDLPKVLHEVAGRPMVEYVLDVAREAGVVRSIVVVGHQAESVRTALRAHDDVEFVLQAEQKGTGHAVMMCQDALAEHDGPVLVLYGDTPLLRSSSLRQLLDQQADRKAACVVGSAETDANFGLGRIVRSADGTFVKIVEQKDATPVEAAVREINTGCIAFEGPALLEALGQLRPANRQGEYYLTDCAEILRDAGKPVLACCCFDITEAMGINTQEQLADVSRTIKSRVVESSG
jgi:bifunctional UDP-N-acetylglucosamine pyrophosphorylase/glucosamine-1-phosphate N-acetyltransferase